MKSFKTYTQHIRIPRTQWQAAATQTTETLETHFLKYNRQEKYYKGGGATFFRAANRDGEELRLAIPPHKVNFGYSYESRQAVNEKEIILCLFTILI